MITKLFKKIHVFHRRPIENETQVHFCSLFDDNMQI